MEGLAQVLEVADLQAVPGAFHIVLGPTFAAVWMHGSLVLETHPDLVVKLDQVGRGGGAHVLQPESTGPRLLDLILFCGRRGVAKGEFLLEVNVPDAVRPVGC